MRIKKPQKSPSDIAQALWTIDLYLTLRAV